MAALSTTAISRSGVDSIPATAAAVGGDTFVNDGKKFIIVKNAAGAPMTLTIVTQATVDGLAVTDKTVSITNGTSRALGPWPIPTYNNDSPPSATGSVALTYSDATSVTVAVFSLAHNV